VRHELISNRIHEAARTVNLINGQPAEFDPRNEALNSDQLGPTSKQLKQLIAARRARDVFFGASLFDDPAWDILLQAYVARLDQTRLSVSAMCIASAVPSTTALRWLNKLEQDGWLVRRADPLDARRTWIELSDAGNVTMERYWGAVWRSLLPV
jgi:hypothetical protein